MKPYFNNMFITFGDFHFAGKKTDFTANFTNNYIFCQMYSNYIYLQVQSSNQIIKKNVLQCCQMDLFFW